MKRLFTRFSALLLALLMLLALPLNGMAAEKRSPIEELALQLQEAQAACTAALTDRTEADEAVADLEAKYEKDPDNAKVQDQLIDAMIKAEEAQDAYAEAFAALLLLGALPATALAATKVENL